MNKRLLMVLALAALLLATGCSWMQHEWDQATTSSGSSSSLGRVYDFPDIQVPTSMRLLPDSSFVFNAQNIKAGLMVFSGRVDSQSLASFFLDSMPADGWKLQSTFKYPVTALFFSKDTRACIINIAEGSMFTEARIWVAPVEGAGH